MRAFIAIRIRPVPEIVGLLEMLAKLGCGKPVEPENLHVNLKFLGEISQEQAGIISRDLDSLQGFGPFRLWLAGVNAFSSHERPRVVWIGAQAPQLLDLQKKIELLLVKQGFPPEQHFSPHVTLARVREKKPGLEKLLQESAGKEFGVQEVAKVCLVQSTLSKTRPTYADVHEVVL